MSRNELTKIDMQSKLYKMYHEIERRYDYTYIQKETAKNVIREVIDYLDQFR